MKLENDNLLFNNKYYYISLSPHKNNNIYFNITNINYYFSFKFKISKIKFNLGFYDENNNLIYPSDLTLNKNISIICYIVSNNTNINIYSYAGIYKNKYYNCIEYIKINEKLEFGIIIYMNDNEKEKFNIKYLFSDELLNYRNINYINDTIFEPLFLNNKYIFLIKKMNDKNLNKTQTLKKSFIKYPNYILKRNLLDVENIWSFNNIFNNYFCFCKGNNCMNINNRQKCKFLFYIYLIDINRNIYLKTDFLFIDLIFEELSSDDVYPIFKKMKIQNNHVHYLTEKSDILRKYNYTNKNDLTIIPINKKNYYNSGDFLEKYLSLFLKLKVVISGKYTNLHSISQLFYNIEYITYIAVGHGVCYFKDYLYSDLRLYGRERNNKILIPPSYKIINLAKKYGWKDEDIIKMNLPRWDQYNNDNKQLLNLNMKKNITENSIFLMFTWRDINKKKEISSYYINNIINLLENDSLNRELIKNNVILYFTLHRYLVSKYLNRFNKILKRNKFIKYINQSEISEILKKVSLFISDFSSIIFDLMYRKKPFIIYIPDVNEPKIKEIYTKDYYNIIESFKNRTIDFENIYLNINETVNKIIFYINNNFNIEKKLEIFYNSFGFKNKNSIDNFISYLNYLK